MGTLKKLSIKQYVAEILITMRNDHLLVYPMGICTFILIGGVIFVAVRFQTLPGKVPLFYSLPWGKERLADKNMLFLLPAIALGLLLFNTIWIIFFHSGEKVLARVLSIVNLIIVVLSIYTLVRIILLIA